MRRLVTLIVMMGASGLLQAEEGGRYRYAFLVQVDEKPAVNLSAQLPFGTSYRFQAGEHLWIEVEVPGASTLDSITTVKLVDDSSGHMVVLDKTPSTGTLEREVNVAYALCGGKLSLFYGAQSHPPRCSE